MQAYHDEEWGMPERDSRALWEKPDARGLSGRALVDHRAAQARGLSRKAFTGFDPVKVARFGEKDVLRLLENPGIIRSRAKIEATIRRAQIYYEMAGQRRGLQRLLLVVHRGQGAARRRQ